MDTITESADDDKDECVEDEDDEENECRKLKRQKSEQFDDEFACRALASGDGKMTMEVAAARGYLRCLEFLHQRNAKCTEYAAVFAVKGKHLGCLRFLCDYNYPMSAEVVCTAARFDSVPCLLHLHRRYQDTRTWKAICTQRAFYTACAFGHLHCSILLLDIGKSAGLRADTYALELAAKSGHAQIVNYLLRSFDLPCTKRAFWLAAMGAHTRVLEELARYDVWLFIAAFNEAMSLKHSRAALVFFKVYPKVSTYLADSVSSPDHGYLP